MILTSQQLAALRQRNDMEIAKGRHAAHGWPKETIRDLLQTLDEARVQKKHWQRIAVRRGELMSKIMGLAELAGTREED